MSNKHTFDPDYAVAPGATLQETIDALGLTQKDLSDRTGLATKTINQIIKGDAPITAETALLLERVTGIDAAFWNNLEANYRDRLARLEARRQMEEQSAWVKNFSYIKMVQLKLLPKTPDPVERVDNLIRFFGVASSTEWETTYSELAGAARESRKLLSDLGDLSAWLRVGEIMAQRRPCESFSREKFLSALAVVRGLTQKNPVEVWTEVEHVCASSGVVVALVPELPRTQIYGFTRWLTPDKALIQLSLRYKTDDILWFTLFHEAAHILLHGKKEVFLEYRDGKDEKEKQADAWASNALIPEREWKAFVEGVLRPVTESDIRQFAREQGVAPSIVLGRLQHREKLIKPDRLNHLKHRLEIVWKGM